MESLVGSFNAAPLGCRAARKGCRAARKGWRAIAQGPGERMPKVTHAVDAAMQIDPNDQDAEIREKKAQMAFRASGGGSVALRLVTSCMDQGSFLPTAGQMERVFGIEQGRAELTERVVRWALAAPETPAAQVIKTEWGMELQAAYYWFRSLRAIHKLAAERGLAYAPVQSEAAPA